MIVLGINNYATNYMLRDVFVMKYSPKVLRKHIEKRTSSSFLYVIYGAYHYECGNGEVYVREGETVYLPKSSCYTYNVLCENAQCIQVEFNLEECSEGKVTELAFSDAPMLISGHTHELRHLFEEMFCSYLRDEFLTLALAYKLLSIADSARKSVHSDRDFEKIAPSMQYIETNFQRKIYIQQLAELCNISQSHLRRLFKKCLGVSPIKYKNSILMRTACNMLLNDGMNVSETAEALNFSDIYTFSQLFKKEVGVSPKKYISRV